MSKMRDGARYMVLSLVAIATIFHVGNVCAQDGMERCLPDDTMAYVSLNDLSSYRTKFEGTALYEIGREPSVRRVLEQIKQSWQDRIEQELGVSLEEWGNVFSGQIMLAVTEFDLEAEKIEAVLAADVAFGQVDKLRRMLSEARQTNCFLIAEVP